jgi:hypothetical protein
MPSKTEFGQVVRYVPAPEPIGMVVIIAILTIVELALVVTFVVELFDAPAGNNIVTQEFLAFILGTALFVLAAILSLYRRWFLPDIMIVKRRKQKYEDLL